VSEDGGLDQSAGVGQAGDEQGAPIRRPRARLNSSASNPAGASRTSLGGLERMVGFAMRRAQLWIFHDFRSTLRELDMTPAQFSVLWIIDANPGLSQARVAGALAIERARLVQMIDRLETAGLVQRERSATDRRSHALHLTAAGVQLIARAHGAFEEHERKVTERLGAKNRAELMRILAPFLS
jgi:DNA-binding MarR family transcriptional regulator